MAARTKRDRDEAPPVNPLVANLASALQANKDVDPHLNALHHAFLCHTRQAFLLDAHLEDGSTLMHRAVSARKVRVLQVLLTLGAEPNVVHQNDCETPLDVAIRLSSPHDQSLVQALQSKNAQTYRDLFPLSQRVQPRSAAPTYMAVQQPVHPAELYPSPHVAPAPQPGYTQPATQAHQNLSVVPPRPHEVAQREQHLEAVLRQYVAQLAQVTTSMKALEDRIQVLEQKLSHQQQPGTTMAPAGTAMQQLADTRTPPTAGGGSALHLDRSSPEPYTDDEDDRRSIISTNSAVPERYRPKLEQQVMTIDPVALPRFRVMRLSTGVIILNASNYRECRALDILEGKQEKFYEVEFSGLNPNFEASRLFLFICTHSTGTLSERPPLYTRHPKGVMGRAVRIATVVFETKEQALEVRRQFHERFAINKTLPRNGPSNVFVVPKNHDLSDLPRDCDLVRVTPPVEITIEDHHRDALVTLLRDDLKKSM